MQIVVDPAAPLPPFAQIRTQIAEQARTGVLPVGTRLPPVRQLADELGVAAGTVARAYKELEADRVVDTRGRHGTFVSVGHDPTARQAFVAAVEFAGRIRRLGLDRNDALVYVNRAFDVDS